MTQYHEALLVIICIHLCSIEACLKGQSNGLFPLPDSDSDTDTDSCTMQDFSTGSDSDSDPLIEI